MKINRKALSVCLISVLAVLLVGFLVSSGILSDIFVVILRSIKQHVGYFLKYHYAAFQIYLGKNGKNYYFLLPEGGYTYNLCVNPLSSYTVLVIIASALFNALFQPVFLCVFSPQALLNYFLFPFFLYGAYKYFLKIPFVIVIFLLGYTYSGLYGSVVEALIRHRMPWELLYLMVGLAGFTDWTTKRS